MDWVRSGIFLFRGGPTHPKVSTSGLKVPKGKMSTPPAARISKFRHEQNCTLSKIPLSDKLLLTRFSNPLYSVLFIPLPNINTAINRLIQRAFPKLFGCADHLFSKKYFENH
ncbi:hypothetical protein AVEN_236136-1 [Araneus ventricosus]|uniref:Uncharacterized protein n=1 Tax=Araneus ventricosus TaxID=182803 RepID=A0A4Y2HUA3_ARAVE|nr:hypothetical protein AVEN_236136-1 [Araneus ventricosus]